MGFRVELTDEVRGRLRDLWDEIATHLAFGSDEDWERPSAALSDEDLQAVLTTLETGRPPTTRRSACPADAAPKCRARMTQAWVDEPFLRAAAELGPVVMTVVLAQAGVLLESGYGASPVMRPLTSLAGDVYDRIHRSTGSPTLLEVSELLDAMGLDGVQLVVNLYRRDYRGLAATWPEEAVARFVLRALPLFLDLVRAGGVDHHFDEQAPFRALATLPKLPESAIDALFEVALGQRKTVRRSAQDALVRATAYQDRVILALGNGKADVRAQAAEWLQRLRYAPAAPALDKAAAKEKDEVVRGAMLDALHSLGVPVKPYVVREGPQEIPTPKGLEWLRFEDLPPVHWADTGELIPTRMLKWIVSQAVKGRSPEPKVLLRLYGELLAPGEREDFGLRLLDRWITHGAVIDLKGLLAVVAVCGGERSVALAEQHLNEWYGVRVAQSKALIAMLAWTEHPAATQLVLSVGTRFRTTSLQQEGARQSAVLAERNGWTTDELADRTVPTEPDKKTLKLQTARLYEAMCTGRTWNYQDWQQYLNQHPTMRPLTQRLVWVADRAFRPLDDGRLTDVDDDAVEPATDARITIAHDLVVDEETRQRWQHYLADYGIVPLFPQFGKETYRLPAERGNDHRLTDFAGRQLKAFTLRSAARQLGYLRGETLDGPTFEEYEKPFPSIGLVAVVTFSGNTLPEENVTVSLGSLCFRQTAPDGGRTAIRLGAVPPVLLSETYHDLRLIAGDD